MSFYWIFEFGWEIIDHAHFLAVFGGYWPRKVKFFQWDPEKALPWVETHRLSHQPWKIGSTRLTCGGEQENNGAKRAKKRATLQVADVFGTIPNWSMMDVFYPRL
jgi:hypothetical protein